MLSRNWGTPNHDSTRVMVTGLALAAAATFTGGRSARRGTGGQRQADSADALQISKNHDELKLLHDSSYRNF